MRKQQLFMFVLLVSLMLPSGSILTHTSAAPPPDYPTPALTEEKDGWSALLPVPRIAENERDDTVNTLAEPITDTVTLPAEASTDWWTTVQEDIRQSEYHVTWQNQTYLPDLSAAYQAPNRAHNLRTYFAAEGLVIVPRVWPEGMEAPPWRWELRLEAWGREEALQPVKAAMLHTDTNRVEYRRGDLTEWYINDEQGLEQGFTLASPPARLSPGHLVLELSLTGDLTPRMTDDAHVVEFITPDGEIALRYSGLHATDATGCELSAELAIRTTRLAILVDDTAAVYPITIDPTITGLSTTAAWVAESDQAGARFGYSVSTAGDVNGDGFTDVIIGAPFYDGGQTDEGRAYVYHGSETGLSTAVSWMVESNRADARFGYSVSTAGDVNGDGYADVIVGEAFIPRLVYVYHGSPAGLYWTANWTAYGDSSFGYSVSAAGDVNGDGYADVIVGVPGVDRAYVYHGSATGLSATANWIASGSGHFGYSVGTAGDVNGDGYADVIVGVPTAGRAYVYHGSPTGLSTTANWTAEGSQEGDDFGASVATAGDVDGDGYSDVIIGAPKYDAGPYDVGRAYLYRGSATGLSTSVNWTAQGNEDYANFGNSVGTAGDVNGDGYADAIVGAYSPGSFSGHHTQGHVYVYHGSATGLSISANWSDDNGQRTSFGYSVSTAGDVNGDGYADVIIGAPGYFRAWTDPGQAYVYHGSVSGLSTTHNWMAEGEQNYAELGTSVSTAGDVNGDGYADVIVGVPGYDGGQTDAGRAYVYHGAPTGLNTAVDWTGESNQAGAYFGYSVGMAGDVNGDGYTDVIIGAYGEDRAYAYHGSSTGLAIGSADWTGEGDQSGAHFGYSVSTAGDVNGDGYADVIVGAHRYDITGTLAMTDVGRAYVYQGLATGLSTSVNWVIGGNQDSAQFGYSVSTAGDVNGDGYSDVIVGSPYYDSDQTNEGRACVYHGSLAGLLQTAAWTAESDQGSALFGWSVGTAGDVQGDGYADVVVGAPYYDGGQDDEGRAYVYHGSATGLTTSPNWTAESEQADARFGTSVGTAGDVNGDGYADVIVGAPLYDESGITDGGSATAYHGSATGLSISPGWTATSIQIGAQLGVSVGTAGDVNGDGYADVIVGTPYYDNGQIDEGRAYVYYGNGGDCLDLTPRQMRTDGSALVAPLGMSDLPTMVQLRLTGRMPLGREKVKLQWQVAPLGTPFTAPAGVIAGESITWTDVLTTGVVITQNVTDLTPETPYHWRARLLYHPGNRMGQSASRWMHVPWNSWTEQDFRTSAHQAIIELNAINDSPTHLGSATTLTATAIVTNSAHLIYITYTWDFGDESPLLIVDSAVITRAYSATGTYTAIVTASNPVNVLTATTDVTILEAPITGLVATNDSPTALGQATTLSGTIATGSNVSYTWDLGDGHFASGSLVTHTYQLGTHSAVVTASNSVSVVTATTTITVDEAISGLSATNDSPTSPGSVTMLTATIAAGTNVSYTWAFGDGATDGGAVITHTYLDVGVYTAIITASNPVSVVTATTPVTITTCLARLNDGPVLYTTVQAAVDAAQDGDTVKVAGYCSGVDVRPRDDITTTGVVTQVVYVSKTVTIRGGYTTTNWTTPYPITQPTTLDAQGQGRVLYITGSISPTVEGLRITGGDADGLGGISGGDAGGGMYVITATATIGNNWIYSNTHGHGAGLCLYRSDTLLSGNIISNNVTADTGGGLYTYHSNTTLRGNTIVANASSRGGGVLSCCGKPSFESNSVTGNTTDGDGGGLYIWGTSATLTGNEVTSNTAGSGGGLYFAFNVHVFTGNTVANNVASSGGGGVLLLTSDSTFVNNLIVRNRAGTSGSGVYVAASSSRLLHNTIADNTGGDSGVYLTWGWWTPSTAVLTNTILANHTVGIYVDSGSTATLESTLWNGNTTDWSGGGTISHNNDYAGSPTFVDPDGGDYHIGPDSAAIDQGIDTGVTTDIDGESRPVGEGYDIGADEFPSALSVIKYADPNPALAGSPLTYTIRVTNTGDVDLYATITDALPLGIVPGQTPGGKAFLPGGQITWTTLITAPGGTWVEMLVITVEMDHTGPLTNVVQVTTEEGTTTTAWCISTVEEAIGGLVAANDSPTSAGRATTLMATVVTGTNVAYTWAFGDEDTGAGAVVVHTYPAVGTYTAVVTASNSVNVVTATTTVTITPIVYLPLVMKRWPPIPYTPTLNPIDNTDQDNYYTVTWQEADLATTYILEEATNVSFSGAQVVYQGNALSWSVPSPGKMPGTCYYRVKARNTWGDSSWSNVRSAVVTWAELIVNGGFESGPPAPPWVQSSNIGEMIHSLGARTGNWGVYMGGAVNAADQIYQRVTIPATAPSPRLYYWRLIRTSDSISTVYDEMRCVIWDTSGNVLAFCGQYSNVNQSQNWIQATYDMSAFRGQTVDIGFKAFNDDLYPTQFFIDDVSLLVTSSTAAQANEAKLVPPNNLWRLTGLSKATQQRESSRLPSWLEPISR